MITQFDKAIAAVLPPIILFANQKWGLKIPVDDGTITAIAGLISAILVYFVPNKPAAPGA